MKSSALLRASFNLRTTLCKTFAYSMFLSARCCCRHLNYSQHMDGETKSYLPEGWEITNVSSVFSNESHQITATHSSCWRVSKRLRHPQRWKSRVICQKGKLDFCKYVYYSCLPNSHQQDHRIHYIHTIQRRLKTLG